MSGKRRSASSLSRAFIVSAFLSAVLVFSACDNPVGSAGPSRTIPSLSRAVYIVNSMDETLSVLDPATGTLYDDVLMTGKWPNAVVPYDGKLFVVNSGDNTVQVFRESDYALLATISLGKGRNPWTLIVDPDRNKGYVPNFLKGSVSVIDLSAYSVTAEIDLDPSATLSSAPEGGCYLNGRVYIGNTAYRSVGVFGEGTVSVIDAASDTLAATLSVEADGWTSASGGSNPQSLIALPSLNQVHVACAGVNGENDGQIVVIDASGSTLEVSGRLAIGGTPLVSSDGSGVSGTVYLSGVGGIMSYDSASLNALRDSSAYLYASDASSLLSGAVYDSASGTLIVADFNDDKILIIDPATGAILRTLQASDGPQSPAIAS